MLNKKFLFYFFILVFFLFPLKTFAASSYPRTANYYLRWELTKTDATQLARYDLLILDMEVQEKSRAQLQKIRQLNPQIIILAYLTSQEIRKDASSSYSSLRKQLAVGISGNWYLKNSQSERLSWWPGTYLLNVTNRAPAVNGERWNQFLPRFVVEKILATGLWDGVFYDNAWDDIQHFAGVNLDLNLDGLNDSNVNSEWREGLKFIYNETRRLSGSKYIIVGNGNTREYKNELNGKMLENFIASAWAPTMNTYADNFSSPQNPSVNIINANTANSGQINYQNLRFGLASALLENGYFSYDYGDQDHGQNWWYDEYEVNLGEPLSASKSQNNYSEYKADIWKRDFSNGLALVNSTADKKTVSLGGEYEKIHGTQDLTVNNGSIITETTIDGYDGLLLLKTFASVQDVLFRNGDFLRFFDSNGNRARNGFFASEAGYKGGDKIARIDLDGNGQRDLLVVSKNKIMAWRDDGQIYLRLYPYTVDYQGELRVALGDLNRDGFLEVYVAPSPGYPLPIKIYTRHGRQMKRDWYPFGEKYFGGYSITVGGLDGSDKNNLVIAKASAEPLVSVFDYNYNLAWQWLAFNRSSGFGLNVAAGNVVGLSGDEVVVGAGAGGPPVMRVFDFQGQQIGSEFTAYSALSKPGIEVLTLDVNYDGKDEIIGMSTGF